MRFTDAMYGGVTWDKTIELTPNHISEVLAGHVVARGLEAIVELTDLRSKSPGSFDLSIRREDRNGIGEAATTRNKQREGLRDVVERLQADRRKAVPGLVGQWTIFLNETAMVREILEQAPALLKRIESAGPAASRPEYRSSQHWPHSLPARHPVVQQQLGAKLR